MLLTTLPPSRVAFLLLAALPALVVLAGSPARAEPRFGDSTWVAPSLADSSDPAAKGPRVAKRDHERAGETVLRAPFRVAFFPLRLISWGIEGAANFAEEHFALQDLQEPARPPHGLSLSPQLSLSGTEGIGAGAALKAPLGPKGILRSDGIWTTADNRRVRASAALGENVSLLAVGVEGLYEFRPNKRFYGIGNDAGTRLTYFLMRENRAEGWIAAGKNPDRRLRALVGLSDVRIGGGYHGTPQAVDVFDEAEVPFLTRGSKVRYYGAAGALGTVRPSHDPSRGILFIGDARHVTGVGDTDLRYEAWRTEARGYIPLFSDRRVIALRGVLEGVDADAGTDNVPFYRLPTAVKQDRFWSYSGDRFRDQRLGILQAEYRWLIWSDQLWAFGLAQRGVVAPSTGQLRYSDMHEGYGGGLRYHLRDTQTVRLLVAKGSQGMNVDLDLDANF